MTRYMIDSIRFDDFQEALKRLQASKNGAEINSACVDIIYAMGGPDNAPEMLYYLVEQEKRRLSNPKRFASDVSQQDGKEQ